jgi:hypothetical protein
MDKAPESRSPEKAIYLKPRLRTIEITADELLGVGCKTATANPGLVRLGGLTCLTNSCVEEGS